MTPDQKAPLKMAPGFFVGGRFKTAERKAHNLEKRTLLTLDLDQLTVEQAERLFTKNCGLKRFEFFAHTSRSHTPEHPRWRIVLPLKKPIAGEDYEPLARFVSSRIFRDAAESMDAVDRVSFVSAQVMYWPSMNRDGEFRTHHNAGELLDADFIFSRFDDWSKTRDFSKLPYSTKREDAVRNRARKAEHPHQKEGIVGAFCRAYSIEEAIEEFLPDVYVDRTEDSHATRYSFSGGSSANGAIVYDDGLFLYSHHDTDPCGHRLVNAFDMVRLHLYGEEDSGEYKNPTSAPSFKAMRKRMSDRVEVKREMLRLTDDDLEVIEEDDESWDSFFDEIKPRAVTKPLPKLAPAEKDPFDFSDDEEDEPVKGEPWQMKLDLGRDGDVLNTTANLTTILVNDHRVKDCIAYNEMLGSVVTRKPMSLAEFTQLGDITVSDTVNGERWTDGMTMKILVMLSGRATEGNVGRKGGYGFQPGVDILDRTINEVATKNVFNPVKEYLESQHWDGVQRAEKLFIDYLGVPDHPYHRDTARLFLLGAVARVYEPGHKFDFVPIIEGKQGKQKSTFVRTLACNWFGELHVGFDKQDRLIEAMEGNWIMELPELSSLSRGESNDIKAFLSSEGDTYRRAYARRTSEHKRRCVFAGTTNDENYLRDATGNRRFWPIKVGVEVIDIQKLKRNLGLIWAEALQMYKLMRAEQPYGVLPLYLSDPVSAAYAEELQGSRRIVTVEDELLPIVQEWLDAPVGAGEFTDTTKNGPVFRTHVTNMDVWVLGLGRNEKDFNNSASQQVAKIMTGVVGWEMKGKRRLPIPSWSRANSNLNRWHSVTPQGKERQKNWKLDLE